ncbi:hypothetical protein DOQ08_02714 [Marinobacter litoralis]|uniref:Uncharacterized protein n=1 Tax=Marinobacter litoralis TaxID=187981 RepID=A0A3M2R9F9_9GAMM|nr:hypothetical protein DOQ08_02714 [Marinobacter litoralis]
MLGQRADGEAVLEPEWIPALGYQRSIHDTFISVVVLNQSSADMSKEFGQRHARRLGTKTNIKQEIYVLKV